MVPTRPRVQPSFDPNSELHPSLSPTAIFPLERAAIMPWADPSKSESSTQLNSSSGSRPTNDLAEFPSLGYEDLIQLREDLLHVHPIYCKEGNPTQRSYESALPISTVILRGEKPLTDLSSEEAISLAGAFREVYFPCQPSS